MLKIKRIIIAVICFFFSNIAFGKDNLPQLLLFLGGDEAILHKKEISNKCVSGAQIIYSWRQLEPQKNTYDFSKIEQDLLFLRSFHKKLFIQLQDRSFEPTVYNVPDYILHDTIYHGGVAMQYDFPGEGKPVSSGWVAKVWDPAVRYRFQLLMQQLASHFDGKIYGINLPETSVDFDNNNLPEGFTPDNYFYAEIQNLNILREAFRKSFVIQYVNFFPGEWNNDHYYMSQLFSYASLHNIGLGGPDVIPYKESQMKNSYPFFHMFKNRVLKAMAIQEPDYTYKNSKTNKYYSFKDFYFFSQKYLHASILFWNIQEPFYTNNLLPQLTNRYFDCNES